MPPGIPAVTLPELPHWLGYPEFHLGYWDPILEACVDTETTVCLHVGSSGMLPLPTSGPRFRKEHHPLPGGVARRCVNWRRRNVSDSFNAPLQ